VIHRLFPNPALAVGACIAGALAGVSSANAGPYSAEYVFGDSLSDNGNLAAAFGLTFPDPPSYHNSFTNGPVAVQLLAQSLGLNLNPSLWVTSPSVPAGTNYAVAGATSSPTATHGTPAISLPAQVGAFSIYNSGSADPNALYVVMIGGNDVRDAALYDTGSDATDAITAGVGTELAEISTLSAEGAKNFLVVNVPNVGIIPEFAQENPGDASNATAYSISYDDQLYAGLKDLGLPAGDRLTDFDLFDFNKNLLQNAGFYGFTNTTDPCFTNTTPPFMTAATTPLCVPDGPGANISTYVYWDHIHPTAGVQALWADGFRAAIPEPSTWAMLLVGFAGLGFAAQSGARKGIAA
jgi:phospholipase/lecithinase/hemolysin